MKKIFGKKEKKLEKKLIEWTNKQMENKKDMEEIKKTLIKKYGERFTKKFIKRNYAIEPSDIELPEDVEDKDKINEVDNEMEELKKKSLEKEEKELPEDLPEETEEKETGNGRIKKEIIGKRRKRITRRFTRRNRGKRNWKKRDTNTKNVYL